MEPAFKTITSLDIAYWVMGVTALRYLTKAPLSRGNDNRRLEVNCSENWGTVRLGAGGHCTTRNGRGCVVYSPDINAVFRGRFARRAKSLEHQRRAQADRIAAQCVSTCRRALREQYAATVKQAQADVATRCIATGTAIGLASHDCNVKEWCFETATPASKKSAAP